MNNSKNKVNISPKVNFTSSRDCFIKSNPYLKTLFPKGVHNLEFTQGQYHNCQFLSAINALSKTPSGAKLLERMITIENGAYKVTFNKFPDKPIFVKKDEIASKTLKSSATPEKTDRRRVKGDTGMKVLEMAYAKLMKAVYPDKFAKVPDEEILSVFLDRNYHYDSGTALRDISGWKGDTLIASGKDIPEESKSFMEESNNVPGLINKTKDYLNSLAKDKKQYAITVCTAGNLGDYLDVEKEFSSWHDYSVLKIDAEKKEIDVSNPRKKNHKLTISYDEFFKYFNLISVVKAPDAKAK